MFAYNVYQHNTNNGGNVPLKGILVGNGCTGDEIGICSSNPNGDKYTLEQLHGHGFISDIAFNAAMAACGDWSSEPPACARAVRDASAEAGNNFDIYDIYSQSFGICDYMKSRRAQRRPVAPGSALGQIMARIDARVALTDNNCTNDDDLTTYMNTPAVIAALHVRAPSGGWGVCGGVQYTNDMKDETKEIYPTLVEKAGLNIVIYNGEADAVSCNAHHAARSAARPAAPATTTLITAKSPLNPKLTVRAAHGQRGMDECDGLQGSEAVLRVDGVRRLAGRVHHEVRHGLQEQLHVHHRARRRAHGTLPRQLARRFRLSRALSATPARLAARALCLSPRHTR